VKQYPAALRNRTPTGEWPLPAVESGVVIEGILMGDGQRRRSSKLARSCVAASLCLCLVCLSVAPAWAAEGHPAPEAAPPSAPSGGAEGPRPDATPQPAQAPPSAPAAAPSTPTEPAPPSVTPRSSSAGQPAATRGPAKHAARARRSHSSSTAHGPVNPRARKPAPAPKPARDRGGHSIAAKPAALPVGAHRDGALLLGAALALGVLALAGMSLLRLLTQFGRLSHAGPQ
jgi:hypothetical protein